MKKTHILLLLAGFAGLCLLAVLMVTGAIQRAKADLAACKAGLEKRGETLDIRRLAPAAVAGKSEGDSLIAATEAAALREDSLVRYAPLGAIPASPGEAKVLHRSPTIPNGSGKDLPWEEFQRSLEPLRPLLGEIRRCARSLQIDMPLDYTGNFPIPVPYARTFPAAGRLLAMESLLSLKSGHTSEALENILTMLRLAEAANRQPLFISLQTTGRLIIDGQITTWEFLQSSASQEDLRRLQQAWEGVSLVENLPAASRMERALLARTFSFPADSARGFHSGCLHCQGKSMLFILLEPLAWEVWGQIFRYGDEEYFLNYGQELLDRTEAGEPWGSILLRGAPPSVPSSEISRKLSENLIPFVHRSLEQLVACETLRVLTVTAVAIRRYQLDHQERPPEALADLVPNYLSALPQDIMTNQPLHYRREGHHFVLYAVGKNGADNGGTPLTEGRLGLTDGVDIVWPRPAAITSVIPSP
jgi:hypothetical protein